MTHQPACTPTDAEDLAAEFFGKHVRARQLSSERDQNFRLEADDGERFVLKISNDAEHADVVEFQNLALRHIANEDTALPVPRIVTGRDGRSQFTLTLHDRPHIVRLMTWLEGRALHDVPLAPEQSVQLADVLGRLSARLGLALRNFDHPASNPPLLWDMKHAVELADLLEYVADQSLHAHIKAVLQDFARLQPTLMSLRSQVIHNDLNPDNVLLSGDDPRRVSGIIDFGDMVKSPLVIDIAVAAAYQLADGQDPLAGALPFLAAYHAVRPLQALEIELLPDLIRTRLATSILIMSWRMQQFPQNRDYLMRSQARFRRHLIELGNTDSRLAAARIREACIRSAINEA